MNDFHYKRFLERWLGDNEFKLLFKDNYVKYLDNYKIKVDVKKIKRFLDPNSSINIEDEIMNLYYFIKKKKKLNDSLPDNPIFKVWFLNQYKRYFLEESGIRTRPPFAIELSKGCSVGCSFCAFSASSLQGIYSYNALEWKKILSIFKKICGKDSGKDGMLFHATDPLDNPEYEKFILDFYDIFKTFPGTTSTLFTKDFSRTRKIFSLFNEKKSFKVRASILSLKMLNDFHSNFTADELQNLTLIFQYDDLNKKKLSGRALNLFKRFNEKKLKKPISFEDKTSSIACVSGFLLNMVDKTVKLTAPCKVSEKWPLGYIIFDEKVFKDPDDLEMILNEMINNTMIENLFNHKIDI